MSPAPIRAAFFGTPAAAVPVLAAVAEIADVALVVTRADKPAGRSMRPEPPPVKEAAADWGLPLAQPDRAGEVAARLADLGVDVAVLAAYGQIIRPRLLGTPRRGFVNVHFSLLPRWRGAAPVERAILAADATTGVSLMAMDEGLDTGAVIATVATPIRPGERAGELTARMASLGARLTADHLAGYVAGDVAASPQDDAAATTAPRLLVAEARLDPRATPEALGRMVRAFHPRPGAWMTVEGGRFKVIRAHPGRMEVEVATGAIELVEGRVLLGAAVGTLELVEVQPAGKPAMPALAWMNGRRGAPASVETV